MKIAGSQPLGNTARPIIEVRTTPTLLHDLTRDHLAGVVRGPNQITIPSDRGQVVCLPRNHDLRIVVRKLRKKIEGRSDPATHSADRTGSRLSAGAIAVPMSWQQ